MFSAIIKGSIVGALVAFIWSFFSWVILPWHANTVQGFENEEYVSWAMKENTNKHGIYIYPYIEENKGKSKEEQKQAWNEFEEKVEKGPYVFASIAPNGVKNSILVNQVQMFVAYLIAAGIMSYLLLKSHVTSYFGRVYFITLIALTAGILVNVINWIWWHYPTHFTVVNIIDLVVTWFIAGLAMSPFIKIKHQHG